MEEKRWCGGRGAGGGTKWLRGCMRTAGGIGETIKVYRCSLMFCTGSVSGSKGTSPPPLRSQATLSSSTRASRNLGTISNFVVKLLRLDRTSSQKKIEGEERIGVQEAGMTGPKGTGRLKKMIKAVHAYATQHRQGGQVYRCSLMFCTGSVSGSRGTSPSPLRSQATLSLSSTLSRNLSRCC